MPVFWSIACLHNEVCDTFTGNYAGSAKQPDFLIRPDLAPYPSILVECGWIESFPQLRKDKDLWIRGCGGFVKLVILIKFSKLAKERVFGKIEVRASDATAHDRLIQTEVVANLPYIFKKTAINSYSLSFLSRPPHLVNR